MRRQQLIIFTWVIVLVMLSGQPVLAATTQETVIWSAENERDQSMQQQATRAAQQLVIKQQPIDGEQLESQSATYQRFFRQTFVQAQKEYDKYYQLGKMIDWHTTDLPAPLLQLAHDEIPYLALMQGRQDWLKQYSNSDAVTQPKWTGSQPEQHVDRQPVQPTWSQPAPIISQAPTVKESPTDEPATVIPGPADTPDGNATLARLPITESQRQFIETLAPCAQQVAQDNDLYASVMIAQAALESSWGTSELSQSPYHNLFGIKGGYQGHSVQMWTKEDNGLGVQHRVLADFRRYPSQTVSLKDYATIMHQPLFEGALKSHAGNYQEATQFLTRRYATDTTYAQKLNQIIQTYELTRYDQAPDTTHTPTSTSFKAENHEPNDQTEAHTKLVAKNARLKHGPSSLQKVLYSGAGVAVCLLLKFLLKL